LGVLDKVNVLRSELLLINENYNIFYFELSNFHNFNDLSSPSDKTNEQAGLSTRDIIYSISNLKDILATSMCEQI